MDSTSRKDDAASPALGDIGITALVPDRWGGPWESRHQFLTRLARWFHVLWVDPPGNVLDVPSRILRPRRSLTHAPEALPEGFRVFSRSYLLPRFSRPRLARLSDGARLTTARRMLSRRGVRKHVLYIWRDRFGSALDRVRHDLSCYHIDDDYTFSFDETPISDRERDLIGRADFVIVSSPGLKRRKGDINPNTIVVPNGVDFASFAAAAESAAGAGDEPRDLRDVPRPRVGYVGVIKRQLDVDAMLRLARERPRYSFVFVGPWRDNLAEEIDRWHELAGLENVHVLGEKHFSELPRYVAALDVCLLCYRRNAYTQQIYPLKLHEYFATGKPVVGPPLESFQEFRGLMHFAESPEAWSEAVDAAVREKSPEIEAARRDAARRHDWNLLAARIAEKICEALGPEDLERFASAREQQMLQLHESPD
jgi:glycosyltransferase involved in cell wall biosynthesis